MVVHLFLLGSLNLSQAQTDTTSQRTIDTVNANSQQLINFAGNDSIVIDTGNATIQQPDKKKKSAINSRVEYSATDSISMDLESSRIRMYKDADIKYEQINVKAAYIEVNFDNNILSAKPLKDTLDKEYGIPEFTEGDQSFKSKEIQYNFNTKKGLIRNVITQEGQGYLHGAVVKKMENDVSNMQGGGYTTCNLDHPHFGLKFSKAKVIPGNKIVTGPAYMTIEDVPIPLILPFGLFPNKKGQTSGVLIPTYGESTERGFYLNNGGYYYGISDYMELKLVGDIYSRGSWALRPEFNYRKRYKFSGSFNFNYAINTFGVRETESFNRKRDFSIKWSHRQDPKARPNSQFNASVNFGSSTFNRYNPVSVQDHLTNTFGSSISYSTHFGERVSLTGALTHSQNTSNKTVNLTLPDISLSVNRFYPLRKPGKSSNLRWYDNISVTYNVNARNEVNTYDSLLFTNNMAKNFRNGVQHRIPASLTLKVLKYFTWTNSAEFNERWYSTYINKSWIGDTYIDGGDTITGYVRTDTIRGFKAVHEYSFNSSVNTSLYGMLQFRKGPVRAIRHVIRPSVSFNYRPDFGKETLGYYRTVQTDADGTMKKYSIFGGDGTFNSIYGIPTNGESGRLNFSINNNLEMKVKSKSDTVTGMKKIILIENLTLGTSYDLASDSLNWADLVISARTTLFKKLQIQYNATFDPYIKTTEGVSLNQFEWDLNDRLFRKESSSWNFSLSYNISAAQLKKGKNPAAASQPQNTASVTADVAQEIINAPENYINWNNSWSFNFSYNLRYNDRFTYPGRIGQNELVQTLGFNGDVNITPKWKVNFTSGYDFELGKLSYTSMSVYRDLHCWEMRFNWIPLGYLKSWNFFIKVKAEVLQDLKLNRKKDFRDN